MFLFFSITKKRYNCILKCQALRCCNVTLLYSTTCKSYLISHSSKGIFSSTQTFSAPPLNVSDLFDKYETRIKIALVPVKESENSFKDRWFKEPLCQRGKNKLFWGHSFVTTWKITKAFTLTPQLTDHVWGEGLSLWILWQFCASLKSMTASSWAVNVLYMHYKYSTHKHSYTLTDFSLIKLFRGEMAST